MRLETEHGEGLIEGALEAGFAEIVGADEAITAITEHPEASSTGERRIHTGDPILFGKQTDVVGALKKHLHQVGSCGATTVQQGL